MAKKDEQGAVDPTKVSSPLGEEDESLATDNDGEGTEIGTHGESVGGYDPNTQGQRPVNETNTGDPGDAQPQPQQQTTPEQQQRESSK